MFELTTKYALELHRLRIEHEKLYAVYNTILPKVKPALIADLLSREITAHRTGAYTNEGSSKTINNVATTIPYKLKEEEECYSCWCFLLIDGSEFEAKIIHKGRGKFKILDDEYGGKYNNKIVDASDVIRCKIEICSPSIYKNRLSVLEYDLSSVGCVYCCLGLSLFHWLSISLAMSR